MTLWRLAVLSIVLIPGAAEACASCISSPFGDRTFNWAYLGLVLAPFGLAIAVGGVLTRCYLASRRRASAATKSTPDEETP